MLEETVRLGLTFDDVILIPAKSEVLPSETNTQTYVSRHIAINIPIISSAMDTVTESRLAIALAREGGIGVIHRCRHRSIRPLKSIRSKNQKAG